MNILVKKMILKVLKDTYDKIEADTCGLDEEEIMSLANQLTHIKLNIEQTCKHLHCTRQTLHRMVCDKRIPKPYKSPGGDKYWYQDELDAIINK